MEHKKIIGFDARMWGSKQTGIGTYIEQLFQHVIADWKRDKKAYPFRFVLFMKDKAVMKELEQYKELITTVHAPYHWYTLQEQWHFYRLLRKHKLDLMHFPNFNFPIMYSGPFVVTIHDLILKFFPGHKRGKNPFRRIGFSLVMDQAIQTSKHIISVSHYTKNDIMRHYQVPETKVSVIYEGVKQLAPTNQKTREVILKKFGIKKPYIFYAGLWIKHKNLPNLVRALWLVRKRHNLPYSLVLGGKEDPAYPETRLCWQGLGLSRYVKRPGFLEGEHLATLYSEASATALPSLYEGFGFIGLESMQAHTPVIASHVSSLPEVFGDAALYINPNDPYDIARRVADLHTSKSLQRTLVQRGNEHIKNFSWTTCAEETRKLYEKLT